MPHLSPATRRRAVCVPLIGLALALVSTGWRAAAAQETASDTLLTVGHYFDLESVGDPQISPDGSQIAFTRGWTDIAHDQSAANLWLVGSDGARPRELTQGAWRDSAPSWDSR